MGYKEQDKIANRPITKDYVWNGTRKNFGKTNVVTIVKKGSNGKSIRTKTSRAISPSIGWTIHFVIVKVIWC
jgi:hypothetical protein